MATLHDFAAHLHNQGVLNLDTPLRDLVTALPALASDAPPTARKDMFCGSWYAWVVTGDDAPRLAEVASVAGDVRAVTGQQPKPVASTFSSIAADQALALDKSGLIDLDRPLRSLLQPEGIGGLVVQARDSCFVTHRYVFLHQ